MAGIDAETLTVAFFAREEGRAKAPDGAAQGGQGAPAAQIAAEGDASSPASCRAGSPAARAGARARARRRRRARALIAQRRRSPAAPAARAREARARARRRARAIGVEEVAGARRQLGRAQGCGRWPTRSSPATSGRDARAARAARAGRAAARPAVRDGPPRARRARRSPRRWPPASPPAQIKRGLRMPSLRRRPADRRRRPSATSTRYRRALELMADLELESRGGGGGGAQRGHRGGPRGASRSRAERT